MSRPRIYDYPRVAELVADAASHGVTPATHVAATLGVARKTARIAIGAARRAGYVLTPAMSPAEARRVRCVIERRPQLRCACGRAYDLDELHLLGVHTQFEHGRTPTATERTPSLGGKK